MTIFVKQQGSVYFLWVNSSIGESPAGWRLAKGGKFPITKFWFDTEKEAKEACIALQGYIDKTANTVKEDRKEKYVETKTIFG